MSILNWDFCCFCCYWVFKSSLRNLAISLLSHVGFANILPLFVDWLFFLTRDVSAVQLFSLMEFHKSVFVPWNFEVLAQNSCLSQCTDWSICPIFLSHRFIISVILSAVFLFWVEFAIGVIDDRSLLLSNFPRNIYWKEYPFCSVSSWHLCQKWVSCRHMGLLSAFYSPFPLVCVSFMLISYYFNYYAFEVYFVVR